MRDLPVTLAQGAERAFGIVATPPYLVAFMAELAKPMKER